MERLPKTQLCPVCGGSNFGRLSICPACEDAFKSAGADPENAQAIDLNRYTAKTFPWEPSDMAPRLLLLPRTWSILCFGLILIVVLLSLLRAPLPTCWEISW
jgi:hypothetical protein